MSVARAFVIPDGPIGVVLSHLDHVERRGQQWIARCPAHDDNSPSLAITNGTDGRVLIKCYAGCTTEDVLIRAGIGMRELFPPKPEREESPYATRPQVVTDHYDYTDADGRVLFQVRRYENPKTFRQYRPDGKGGWVAGLDGTEPVLFNLPNVIEAVALGKRVYICEGEKDALNLINDGLAATTAPMGAGKWRDSMSEVLRDAPDVVILPDNDEPGRQHAALTANSLVGHGVTVRIVPLPGLPEKGDVSDWLDAGGDYDTLEGLVQATRPAAIDPALRKSWRLSEVLADLDIMRAPTAIIPRLAWKGRSTLLAASIKTGKSTLVGFLATQVSQGGFFLNAKCEQGTVLIVGLEEGLGDLARRLRDFDADPYRVHIMDRVTGTATERIESIRAVVAHITPTLVIVDTLTAYGMGIVEDENSSAQMQPLVQGLSNMAHLANSYAMILVHHNNKAGSFRGSSAIGGAVDVIVEMSQHEDAREPTLRHFKVQGRFPVNGFDARYMGRDYVMTNAEGMPLIQRVLDFIRVTPGCSKRTIRDVLGGRAANTDAAIDNLLLRHAIRDESDDPTECRYVASMTAPATVDLGQSDEPEKQTERPRKGLF